MRELFHISVTEDWVADQRAGVITDSTRGRTLEQEGFIHCSYLEQVAETARRVYGDLDEVIVVRIDPARLSSRVFEEDLAGSGERFPHVYGPIELDAVIEARSVRPDAVDLDS